MKEIITCLFVTACMISWCECGKYDMPDINEPNPFRMGKINLIWEKAKRKKDLDEKQMAELFAELTLHDKKQRELKQKLIENTDVDGLFEAGVRRELVGILKKYALKTHFPNEDYKADKKLNSYELKDDNLRTLMKDAKKEGFTAQEIETLRQELGHHQMKLDEFDALKEEYRQKADKVDNSVENLDQQDALWKELQERNMAMKEKHKQLKQSMEQLKMNAKRSSRSEFEDPRVIHLWTLAQKSGVGGEELDSIRKELTHFEHRIKKTAYMKEQMGLTKEKIQAGKNLNVDHLEKRHQEMQDRAAHYEAMVDKHHADIKTRIQKRLDEL